MEYKNEETKCDDNDVIMSLDDDNDSSDRKLFIKSNEEDIFITSPKNAKISKLINEILNADPEAGSNEDDPILLNYIESRPLEIIVKYMEHHNGCDDDIPERPLRSAEMEKILKDSWDAKFCDNLVSKDYQGNVKLLFDVILASNYMDMNELLYKLCAKVASLLKNKSFDEIHEILNDVRIDTLMT